MKRILAGIIVGVIIFFGVKSYAGIIDFAQREGQTNQLEISNKLMIENNNLLKEIRDLLKEPRRFGG